MIYNLLQKFFGHRDVAEDMGRHVISSASTEMALPQAPDITRYADPEIQIVAGRYGELFAGKVIETTLTELQEILPRPRKRADAYQSLSKRLAAMGVTLVIKREVRHGK